MFGELASIDMKDPRPNRIAKVDSSSGWITHAA
jgi:hypothetical protein